MAQKKKISTLQKQRQNKQLLMSELESLEDKLRTLSNKADTTRRKTQTKRKNTQNLSSIMDRWKDVSARPEPPQEVEPPILEAEEVPIMEAPVGSFLQNTDLTPACQELEKSVLKQSKMCINLILSKTMKSNDPMLMSLISGTNETVDDYEKLYQQLKLMVFMEKMNEGPARNELLAFVFSTL